MPLQRTLHRLLNFWIIIAGIRGSGSGSRSIRHRRLDSTDLEWHIERKPGYPVYGKGLVNNKAVESVVIKYDVTGMDAPYFGILPSPSVKKLLYTLILLGDCSTTASISSTSAIQYTPSTDLNAGTYTVDISIFDSLVQRSDYYRKINATTAIIGFCVGIQYLQFDTVQTRWILVNSLGTQIKLRIDLRDGFQLGNTTLQANQTVVKDVPTGNSTDRRGSAAPSLAPSSAPSTTRPTLPPTGLNPAACGGNSTFNQTESNYTEPPNCNQTLAPSLSPTENTRIVLTNQTSTFSNVTKPNQTTPLPQWTLSPILNVPPSTTNGNGTRTNQTSSNNATWPPEGLYNQTSSSNNDTSTPDYFDWFAALNGLNLTNSTSDSSFDWFEALNYTNSTNETAHNETLTCLQFYRVRVT